MIEFGIMHKINLRFLRQTLLDLLMCGNEEECMGVFKRVGHSEKLKGFRGRLRLFIQHLLLRNLDDSISDKQRLELKERADFIVKNFLSDDRC